jgi:membrane fusion protein (multidrug efflux system)
MAQDAQPSHAVADAAPPPPRRRRRIGALAALVALLIAAGAAYLYIRGLRFESTDDAYIEGHVVQISPRVEGQVARVHVRDNQDVRSGDPLVDLDPRDYEVRLADAQAQAHGAEGRLKQARAQVEVAKAAVAQAKADLAVAAADEELARSELRRYQAAPPKAVAEQQVDRAAATSRAATARAEAARQRVTAAEAQVALGEAQVATGEADLERARAGVRQRELELSYTRIKAPRDGRVTRKNVEPGNYVKTGQALFALVSRDVWVVANFKETQLTHMRPGQRVDVTVDAFPDRRLRARVDSIQAGTGARFSLFPPENATGNFVKVVQRVPVKIVFDEADRLPPFLAPGLSVIPRVRIREEEARGRPRMSRSPGRGEPVTSRR